MGEKNWKTWKGDQDIVMDQELVQNGVMDGKIDPKVVMDLLIFTIGGWYILQSSNRKLLEESMDENEPWLLIRSPSEDSFFMTRCWERLLASLDQHVKELMSLREGLHVTTQGYIRQHFADRHSASWRETTSRKIHEVRNS